MATPWDRSAAAYLDEWIPRFVPYHLDLVNELALLEGDRVLVASAGAGQEVLAAARAVGERGAVRATDRDAAMVAVCKDLVAKAGFKQVECHVGEQGDVAGGPFDAVICAFGLWSIGSQSERANVLSAWSQSLGSQGKVGVLTWGPLDEGDPFLAFSDAMRSVEPDVRLPGNASAGIEGSREAFETLFAASGLSLVRHTILRHTLSFKNADTFVVALSQGAAWRKIWDELGEARMRKVAAKFYETLEKNPGGAAAPVSFSPAVTLAIAALPGAEVNIAARSSIRVPVAEKSRP